MTESTRADRPSFSRTLADRHPAFMQAVDGLGVPVRQADPMEKETVRLVVQLAAQQRPSAGARTQ